MTVFAYEADFAMRPRPVIRSDDLRKMNGQPWPSLQEHKLEDSEARLHPTIDQLVEAYPYRGGRP